VPFELGFTFQFYGSTYDTAYLNTNGGLTFVSESASYDVAAVEVSQPGIAVFWGDMDAGDQGADTRPNQMSYQQCSDHFQITYASLQDNDDGSANNSATLSLHPDGTIDVTYGEVLSQDILVGLFDGSHSDDRYLSVQATYSSYATTGTGIILFDSFGSGPSHTGNELTGQTLHFVP